VSNRSPQLIAFEAKKKAKPKKEQISFALTGPEEELKKRFIQVLDRRGLGIKEVLLQFIEHYVEFGGDLVMLAGEEAKKLAHSRENVSEVSESTDFPQSVNNFLAVWPEILSTVRTDPESLRAFLSVVLNDPAMRQIVAQSLNTQVAVQADVEHHSDAGARSAARETPVRSGQNADRGQTVREDRRVMRNAEEAANALEQELDSWDRNPRRNSKRNRKTG
jgi:hypothetical protein